jgi:hypothetical protein
MFDEDSPLTGHSSRVRHSFQPWGISALAIGCTLLLSACVLMVFNISLFQHGLFNIPLDLARVVGIIGVLGVALLGLASVAFGIRGWRGSGAIGESTGFGVAGTLTSLVGLAAWLIAGADLLAILQLFA